MQQLIQAGFLSNGSHNLSYAHQQHHIDALIKFYQQELPKIAWLDKTNTLNDSLNCPVMQPVFKVR
jgi:glutamate-1-semialdehyde 2,1-aminomutase